MHSSQLQGETAQLGNAKQIYTYVMSVEHNYSSTATPQPRRSGLTVVELRVIIRR